MSLRLSPLPNDRPCALMLLQVRRHICAGFSMAGALRDASPAVQQVVQGLEELIRAMGMRARQLEDTRVRSLFLTPVLMSHWPMS